MFFRCSSRLNIDTLFESAHLSQDLGRKSVRGGMATMFAQGGSFALQLIRIAVLARLLTPEDFGLIGMVMVLTGFLAIFKDAGLSMATVQRDEITHEQISSLFWVNVGISSVLACVMAACSPLVAWFYKQPELLTITLVLSLSFPVTGLIIQHQALLRRHMRFGTLAFIQLTTVALTLAVTIITAWMGWHYWALVAGQLAGPVFNVILVWILVPWWPGKFRRGTGALPMLKFGGHLTGSSFMSYVFSQYPNLLLGRMYDATILAFYQKSLQLVTLPLQQAQGPIAALAVPAMARLQNNPEQYRRYFQHQWILMRWALTPICCCTFVMYDWIVNILLGPQWGPVVKLYPIMAFGVILVCGSWSCESLFISQGRTVELLKYHIIRLISRIFVVSIFVSYSVYVLAAANAVYGNIVTLILLWCVGSKGPVNRKLLFGLALGNGLFLCGATAMGWGLRLLVELTGLNMWFKAGIVGICCVAGSFSLLYAFSENRTVLLTLLRHILHRKT